MLWLAALLNRSDSPVCSSKVTFGALPAENPNLQPPCQLPLLHRALLKVARWLVFILYHNRDMG
jgi:hypothetical protein